MVVEVDEEDYKRGVEHPKFSVIGRMTMQRGIPIPTTMEVKNKLSGALKILNFKVIPLGKGLYHILFHSLSDQCTTLASGIVLLKPGLMRFNRWMLGFNISNQTRSSTQVWIRILHLPLEFRKPQNLLNIAMCVGLPIKIDPLMLSLYHGLFARVLFELDLSRPLPERIPVTKKN